VEGSLTVGEQCDRHRGRTEERLGMLENNPHDRRGGRRLGKRGYALVKITIHCLRATMVHGFTRRVGYHALCKGGASVTGAPLLRVGTGAAKITSNAGQR
jgi:hypothetical protein